MGAFTLPSRASDAGPMEAQPRDWYELICEAEDELKAACRTYRDDSSVQRKLRLEAIDAAMDWLRQARQMVAEGL